MTLSTEYWDSCCGEGWDASVAGPLRLGDVGEVTSALPPEANDPSPYTVLAPSGVRWKYGAGQVLPLIGEVKCALPGLVKVNTVGNEMNQLKEVDDLPDGMGLSRRAVLRAACPARRLAARTALALQQH